MSFLFGDSSNADEVDMGNIFGDGGREDSPLDKRTSDVGGDSFFTSTSTFGGTPTKKDTRPSSSQSHWDSGSSGGAGAGSAPKTHASVTGRSQEDTFLAPSPFPPPEKKRNYGPSPTKAQPQQRDMKEASIPPESKYREATVQDARSGETPPTMASGRTSSLVPTGSSSVLRELLVIQQKQVAALLPELEEAEGRDKELETALELVARESRAYRQQLGSLREQYSARVSQVTGFLKRP